jgi:putative transposase
MPNTYTRLQVHIVFAVKHRNSLISARWRVELQKVITGIVNNRKQKIFAIYCMPNHVHILVGYTPDIVISDIVRDIKAGSSKWINDRKLVQGRFEWQTGYSAFSVGYTGIQDVINYILNQEEHHKTRAFKDENVYLLKQAEVDFDERFILSDI